VYNIFPVSDSTQKTTKNRGTVREEERLFTTSTHEPKKKYPCDCNFPEVTGTQRCEPYTVPYNLLERSF
jgi:hypothetical protein